MIEHTVRASCWTVTMVVLLGALSASGETARESPNTVPTVYGVSRLSTLPELAAQFPAAQIGSSAQLVHLAEDGHPVSRVWRASTFVRLSFVEDTSCREVFDHLYAAYGGPHVVAHGAEASTPTHRRVWRLGHERIALYCAQWPTGRVALQVDLTRAP